MRVTILGSGTVVADAARVCASCYVEAGDSAHPVRLLLDCGPGATHRMAGLGIDWPSLSHVAVTHFHTDHIGDLPYLFFALTYGLAQPRSEPLALFGPAGTMVRLRALADGLGSFMLHPGVRLNVHELGGGHEADLESGIRIRAYRTLHTDESIAYRVETNAGVLGYTGDTGPDPELGRWLRGVHTLVTECSLPDDAAVDRHLTPATVAELARTAAPERLVLTHVYPQLDRRALPSLVAAAGWTGELIVAEDGTSFEV